MDIKTLESFRLSDAISFHDELNPKLFSGDQLRPEVRKQLMIIAQDFLTELGINDLDVKDITISGSNAAYSYTPHSDLDLHILVDVSGLSDDEIYLELFNAKKTTYNDSHDITIHGIPIELYVQDASEPVVSLGEYSVLHDKWLRIPTKRRANFDQTATKVKYNKLLDLIHLGLKTKSLDKINNLLKTIKRYRQAGLDKGGEFGPENLAYKILRKQGYITKLYDLRNKLHSARLSIEEESKVLDKPTLSIRQLAMKHNVSVTDIMDQLLKGINVELEHTNNEDVAREIALDHLGEDPQYYIKLAKAGLEEDSYTMNPSPYAAEKTAPVTPYGNKEKEFRGSMAEASGYIPSEKEKNDPRFKTALTVDIKPDTMKKNAKAFGNKISRAGIPPTANPNGKF